VIGKDSLGLVLLGGLATALLFPVQSAIDARRPPRPSALLYMPDKRLMKVIACGHGPALADFVWVQSNNYVIGEFKGGKTHVRHLYELYDTITELNPELVDAYVLGSVFLSSVAQEPQESIHLVEKGEGVLVETADRIVADENHPGRVNPRNPDRWKLLNEYAGIFLVIFAGDAPTADERLAEIRRAGRIYLYGAERYPVERYPTVPDWFETMGKALSVRRADQHEREAWSLAVRALLELKIQAAGADSPVRGILKRRLLELDTREGLDKLELALLEVKRRRPSAEVRSLAELVKPAGPLESLPRDPLGGGFLLVDGKVTAPALDAARVERELARRVGEFQSLRDRFPISLDELREDLSRRGAAPVEIPSWVQVYYEAPTGEVRAVGHIATEGGR
jgi:hypothetical protein